MKSSILNTKNITACNAELTILCPFSALFEADRKDHITPVPYRAKSTFTDSSCDRGTRVHQLVYQMWETHKIPGATPEEKEKVSNIIDAINDMRKGHAAEPEFEVLRLGDIPSRADVMIRGLKTLFIIDVKDSKFESYLTEQLIAAYNELQWSDEDRYTSIILGEVYSDGRAYQRKKFTPEEIEIAYKSLISSLDVGFEGLKPVPDDSCEWRKKYCYRCKGRHLCAATRAVELLKNEIYILSADLEANSNELYVNLDWLATQLRRVQEDLRKDVDAGKIPGLYRPLKDPSNPATSTRGPITRIDCEIE